MDRRQRIATLVRKWPPSKSGMGSRAAQGYPALPPTIRFPFCSRCSVFHPRKFRGHYALPKLKKLLREYNEVCICVTVGGAHIFKRTWFHVFRRRPREQAWAHCSHSYPRRRSAECPSRHSVRPTGTAADPAHYPAVPGASRACGAGRPNSGSASP